MVYCNFTDSAVESPISSIELQESAHDHNCFRPTPFGHVSDDADAGCCRFSPTENVGLTSTTRAAISSGNASNSFPKTRPALPKRKAKR